MYMEEDECALSQRFFSDIMTLDDVLEVKVLLTRIQRAPAAARNYLQRRCRDATELEEFFRDNDHLFFMENRRIALFQEQLVAASELSVEYFSNKLKAYTTPVNFLTLKMKHLEHAPENICIFITRFYPGKEFKKFFQRRPDTFVLHKDKTAFLVEADSVAFYRKRLKALRGQKQYFLNFRGHIGHAPPHVQTFINTYFLGDKFQDFLIRNNDVFVLDDNGHVGLKEQSS